MTRLRHDGMRGPVWSGDRGARCMMFSECSGDSFAMLGSASVDLRLLGK
jgi:hypothetical protein